MGFLNHSTNNIIIDAVLTERGRELLSLNNGSFKISKFSCSDDEVDYSLVTKYGKNIGKEKIEKNTPIFEAITNQNLALKYPLRSFGNVFNQFDTLTKIPVLKELNNVTSITLKSDVANTNLTDKTIDIINFIDTTDSSESVNKNLVDKILYVKVDSNLLKVKNGSVYSKDKDIIVYRVPVSPATNKVFSNQIQGAFTITAKNVVNDTTYTKYSDGSNNTTINTQIQVVGDVSGSSYIIPVKIEKT